MKLHNLKPAKGAIKNRRRIARGEGGGTGDTATRGHKGQKSRSGYKVKRHFEGGQMPLQMRLPKRGFKNINRIEYTVINLDRLQAIAEKLNLDKLDVESLVNHNIINKDDRVKILGKGELNSKLEVSVHACSASAKEAIEKAGGTVNVLK